MAEPAKKKPITKVITGRIRGSYVNVFQPRKNDQNGKMEYSMVVLLPKKDKSTKAKLDAAIDAAIDVKWPNGPPKGLMKPVHDGDGQRPRGGDYGRECKGHWVINVKSQRRPGVVDADMDEVIEASEFESGDYCKVSLNAYGYDVSGNKGVSFGLNNVMVMEKGEPLGNVSTPEDDFGADAGDDEDW